LPHSNFLITSDEVKKKFSPTSCIVTNYIAHEKIPNVTALHGVDTGLTPAISTSSGKRFDT
jgi:hypothetical protein